MWKLAGVVLLLLTLLLVGCSKSFKAPESIQSQSELRTAISGIRAEQTTQEPPADRTWLSPGKVQIGNFHLGGRAEWNVTIHNGNKLQTAFSVSYRKPDFVGADFYTAPTDIVQNWVIIADTTPLLTPKETRNIMVAVVMPNELSNTQAEFYEILPKSENYLNEQHRLVYQQTVDDMIKQYGEKNFERLVQDVKSRGTAIDEMASKLKRSVVKETEAKLLANPEVNLLLYLTKQTSVSKYKFATMRSASDAAIITQLKKQGFVKEGNLKTNNWEFWISVFDNTQTGIVTTEICSRWLVKMR